MASADSGLTDRNEALDSLLARARDMIPVLRERSLAAEEARRMPLETVGAFRDAGFYRILQPARYGGYELDYIAQVDLSIEIGRGCASSAWDASVTACHSWILGMFPGAAQDDVWGDEPAAEISSSFFPVNPQITRVDGGFRVSGRWKFSSGVDHCRWTIILLPVAVEGEGRLERFYGLLPLSDCRVEDVWRVAGLSGTGSNDIVIEDAFVPEHRTVPMAALRGGGSPGSAVNAGHIYRLPLLAVFPYNLLGPGIGAARGVLEQVIAQIKARTSHSTGVRVADLQSAHLRIAEAAAEIDAAYLLLKRNADEFNSIGRAGGVPELESRVRYRRDTAYASVLCTRAVDRLFPLLGGQGLSSDNWVQRAWRDVRAVGQHIGTAWDLHGGNYGSTMVGNPPADPNL